ncbi:MAG: helix-turn-helix domain-containing protein [Myxococcota bacterium]
MDRIERGALSREQLEPLLESIYESAVALEGRPSLGLAEWLRHAEAWRIRLALHACGGDKSAAARRLGVPRRTLYHRMHLLGLMEASGETQR